MVLAVVQGVQWCWLWSKVGNGARCGARCAMLLAVVQGR